MTWSDGLTSGASAAKATQLNQVSPIDPFAGASTNNNGLHDMVEVPPAGSTSKAIAYNDAAAVIVINSSIPLLLPGHVTITDNQGNALEPADTLALMAAINYGTTSSIYDQREAQNVVLTTLDMAKLAAATVAPAGKTATPLQRAFVGGGTIYIHDVSPMTVTEPAIRLVNGRDPGPERHHRQRQRGVYPGRLQYRRRFAPQRALERQQPDRAAIPQAAGYSRYSASVMADAVTILSNNWLDR